MMKEKAPTEVLSAGKAVLLACLWRVAFAVVLTIAVLIYLLSGLE